MFRSFKSQKSELTRCNFQFFYTNSQDRIFMLSYKVRKFASNCRGRFVLALFLGSRFPGVYEPAKECPSMYLMGI